MQVHNGSCKTYEMIWSIQEELVAKASSLQHALYLEVQVEAAGK